MSDLYIIHYGVGHDKGGHSGRYPWGSGENPYGGKKNLKYHIKDRKKIYETIDNKMKRFNDDTNETFNNIVDIVENAYYNSDIRKENDKRGIGAQDFFLDISEDKRKFIEGLVDIDPLPSNSPEQQKDIRYKLSNLLDEYRKKDYEYNQDAKEYIKNIGMKYDLRKIIDNESTYRGSDFIKRYVKNHFNKQVDKYFSYDPIQMIEDIMAIRFD